MRCVYVKSAKKFEVERKVKRIAESSISSSLLTMSTEKMKEIKKREGFFDVINGRYYVEEKLDPSLTPNMCSRCFQAHARPHRKEIITKQHFCCYLDETYKCKFCPVQIARISSGGNWKHHLFACNTCSTKKQICQCCLENFNLCPKIEVEDAVCHKPLTSKYQLRKRSCDARFDPNVMRFFIVIKKPSVHHLAEDAYQKGSKLTPVNAEAPKVPPPIEAVRLHLDTLKEATHNFRLKRYCISIRRVFYANINSVAMAIKKIDVSSKPDSEYKFLTEVSKLSRLKHDNVVDLLGYCVEDKTYILAYEFATMGTLRDILHGGEGVRGAQRTVLDWMQRVRIALEAARGLEYLHEKTDPSIIHKDIRSSNVLLFKDFKAKIADFNIINQALSLANFDDYFIVPAGGYRPPEYKKTGCLTQKGDIYNFGVVLLELLTGRKALDYSRREPYLLCWATPRLSEDKVKECVDPKLKGEYPPEGAAKLAAVAAMCLRVEPELRPNMSSVVEALLPLLSQNPPAPAPETCADV